MEVNAAPAEQDPVGVRRGEEHGHTSHGEQHDAGAGRGHDQRRGGARGGAGRGWGRHDSRRPRILVVAEMINV